MHLTTTNPPGTRHDGNLVASKVFADVFQGYLECSNDIQAAVREMVHVVNAPDATEEEREAALATIAETLFRSKSWEDLGVCLEESERLASSDEKPFLEQMDQEEATFSHRVTALLEARGMTQSELAEVIDVGQPAISMMLARNCRPQRRTVEKIAKALKITPQEIWPGFEND